MLTYQTLHVKHDARKSSGAEPPMTTWQLLKHPGVAPVILIYNYVLLLAFTWTAVNPVFFYTPVRLGGIGFSPEQIAAVTALAGASQATWTLLVFSPLHKRVGTGRILWLCAFAWPVFFATGPVYNILLRYNLRVVFWSIAPPAYVIGSGIAMAFSAYLPNLYIMSLLTRTSCCSACIERHCALA
jgi:hypothetical protein